MLEGEFCGHLHRTMSVMRIWVAEGTALWPRASVSCIRGVAQYAIREVEFGVAVAIREREQGMVQWVERREADIQILVIADLETLEQR